MSTTALLIIDAQNDFLHEKGSFSKRHIDAYALADSIALLAQAAHQLGWRSHWVQSFYGETPQPVVGQTHVGSPCCVRGSWGMAFFEPLQDKVGAVVLKQWYSAFKDTDLHAQLQAAGVRRVVLCGVASNVCVAMTAQAALDLGYQVDVVEDATTAGSLPKHLSVKIISCGDVLQEGPLKLTGFGAQAVLYTAQEGFAKGDFEALYQEIQWHTMFHRGGEVPRRVALQGSLGPTGEQPLYRHPADEQPPLQPWTPGVDRLRRAAEKLAGHPLNHGLLQLYRDGRDWIGAHSDKTLDVMSNTFIVNVSLGATRNMVLRPKETGHPQRIVLPNGSVLLMDLETNRRWFHEIRQQGAAGEIGPRISLTFRYIGSFWHPQSQAIWGTGTPYTDASQFVAPSRVEVLEESDRMLRLFREENQDPNFDMGQYQPGFRIPNLQVWREATCENSTM